MKLGNGVFKGRSPVDEHPVYCDSCDDTLALAVVDEKALCHRCMIQELGEQDLEEMTGRLRPLAIRGPIKVRGFVVGKSKSGNVA